MDSLLCVGLRVGPRGGEGGQRLEVPGDGQDPRPGREVELHAPRVGDLRHEADVGQRHALPKQCRPSPEWRADELLQRLEAARDPVPRPARDARIILPELGSAGTAARAGC